MRRSAGLSMTVRNSLSVRSAAATIMTRIIMDPPSYGRGPKGEIWKIEDSIHPFIQAGCTRLLSDEPLFFLVNSYTTGLAPAVLTYMIATELKRFGGHVRIAGDRTAGNEERARAAVRGIRTVGSMIGGLASLYMF